MTDKTGARALINCSRPRIDTDTGEVTHSGIEDDPRTSEPHTVAPFARTGYTILEEDVDPWDVVEEYEDDEDVSSIETCHHILTLDNVDDRKHPTKRLLGKESYTALRKDDEIRLEPSRDVHTY